jgi:hypothetical protein
MHVENQNDWGQIEAQLWLDTENNEVKMTKTCGEHGEFEDLISTDIKDFLRAEKFAQSGTGIQNPINYSEGECPTRCGLCYEHDSKTNLAIIDVTNRCNMKCPVCFANAGASGYIYEPSISQLDRMLAAAMKVNFPKGIHALQLSGGEPTVRNDLPDIVKLGKKHGINHITVDTNGLRIGDPERGVEYLTEIKDAGVSTLYLQFDAPIYEPRLISRVPTRDGSGREISQDTKIKLAKYYTQRQLNVVDNARKADFHSIVLVVTLQRGVNDNLMGSILNYAGKNSDVVRCVNFQPVSGAGRMDKSKMKEVRITHADVGNGIEEQTWGQIRADDLFPIPAEVPLAKFVELVKGKSDYYDRFSTHVQCGRATMVYVKKEDDKVKFDPITRHMNAEKLYQSLNEAKKSSRIVGTLKGLAGFLRYTDLKLKKDMAPLLFKGSYEGASDFMKKVLMIGEMWFMDVYNFDFQRVNKCTIHYLLPDERYGARVIPFCTMNNFHRPTVERKLSIPVAQYKNA